VTQPTVTLVTSTSASADTLTDADYRDIYDELRSKCPLRQFADLIHSAVSFAWWSKYERGEAHLNRPRRAELRAAVGLPALPPAVADVLAAVDPDASIYQVGAGASDRVLLVGSDVTDTLDLRLNGSLRVLDEEPARNSHVTAVTPPRDRSSYAGLTVRRETRNRLDAARVRSGLTWDQFLSYWASRLEVQEDVTDE
jgi:hypothetical protein